MHFACLHLCLGGERNVIADLKSGFQNAWSQGQCDMASIVIVAASEDVAVVCLVEWVGFGPDERTCEALDRRHSSSPEVVRSEPKMLHLTRRFLRDLWSELGIYSWGPRMFDLFRLKVSCCLEARFCCLLHQDFGGYVARN